MVSVVVAARLCVDIPVTCGSFNMAYYQSINQSINLLVEPGTNISRDEVQSVEQQDIQGSQRALTYCL